MRSASPASCREASPSGSLTASVVRQFVLPGDGRASTAALIRVRCKARRSEHAPDAALRSGALDTGVERSVIPRSEALTTKTKDVPKRKPVALRYGTDSGPGITRLRQGNRVRYRGPRGGQVSDRDLARISALAIPPAWRHVWISPDPASHLQATGRDQKGRKQYRYHPDWQEGRSGAKFERMIAFAEALPRIRECVERDLGRRGLPRRKVLATVVRLLDLSGVRIGNVDYARSNGSFGLTTLQDRHVRLGSTVVSFAFTAKGGAECTVDIRDARLARIIRQCRDLPGRTLFQYIGDDGARRSVGSHDVNRYIAEISGGPFTAKDFRTWAGTVVAASALNEAGPASSEREAERNVRKAIDQTSAALRNTAAVSRKSYVHPGVVEVYLEQHELDWDRSSRRRWLSPEERATLALLKSR